MHVVVVDDNLKTGSYADWRKISAEFACQGHFLRVQGH